MANQTIEAYAQGRRRAIEAINQRPDYLRINILHPLNPSEPPARRLSLAEINRREREEGLQDLIDMTV